MTKRQEVIKARKAKKLSQEALAGIIGVKRTTITNIETGYSMGARTTWDRLEAALGVDQKVLREIDKENS